MPHHEEENTVKRIKTVIKRVGTAPQVEAIDVSVESFQAIVGGYFEPFPVARGVVIYCCENWRSDPRPNCCGFYGNFFFVGIDEKRNERSLNDEEIRKAFAWIERRKDLQPPSEQELRKSLRVLRDPKEIADHQSQLRRSAQDAQSLWDSL
jgi:hypothetical protein